MFFMCSSDQKWMFSTYKTKWNEWNEMNSIEMNVYIYVVNSVHYIFSNSKFNYHRNLRDDDGFMIRYFASAVCYQTV